MKNPRVELLEAQVTPLVERIKPLFDGQHPVVIGTVLAELVAIHLATYPPNHREGASAEWAALVQRLVPNCEALIFPDGRPEGI
jgi:hypothetical protein